MPDPRSAKPSAAGRRRARKPTKEAVAVAKAMLEPGEAWRELARIVEQNARRLEAIERQLIALANAVGLERRASEVEG